MFQNPVRAVGLGPEGWASSVQEVGGQERWQEAGVKEAPRAAGASCLAFPACRGPASLLDRKVESSVWPYEVRARLGPWSLSAIHLHKQPVSFCLCES